jgi:hypothetical protein
LVNAVATSLAVLGTGLAATGCNASFSLGADDDQGYRSAAEELIEQDLAERIGLGPLEASCTGDNLSPGDVFDCEATGPEQGPIRFEATVNDAGDGVDLHSTNILLADQVAEVEAFAASLIAAQTFTDIAADDFECADSTLVVASGDTVSCTLTDPADNTTYEAWVVVDDVEELSITVTVGDPIR